MPPIVFDLVRNLPSLVMLSSVSKLSSCKICHPFVSKAFSGVMISLGGKPGRKRKLIPQKNFVAHVRDMWRKRWVFKVIPRSLPSQNRCCMLSDWTPGFLFLQLWCWTWCKYHVQFYGAIHGRVCLSVDFCGRGTWYTGLICNSLEGFTIFLHGDYLHSLQGCGLFAIGFWKLFLT